MNTAITITESNGIEIRKTDQAPGIYQDGDAPIYLGAGNCFVGASFDGAQAALLGELEAAIQFASDDYEMLSRLTESDVVW